MQIGAVNVAAYHARQHTVTFYHNSIENESDWTAGSAVPFFDRNRVGFKEWTVTLIVKGATREEIIMNCSTILSLLIGEVELTLDGFTHTFCGILKDHDRKENVPRRYHMLELTFEGYEHGDEIVTTGNGVTSFTVQNTGNLPSPCIVEITPVVGAASVTVGGICRDSYTGADLPVTIENLSAGQTVVLSGLTGLITQGGAQKGKDVSIWALPSMKPGSNTVTINSDRMNVTVRTIPIFM